MHQYTLNCHTAPIIDFIRLSPIFLAALNFFHMEAIRNNAATTPMPDNKVGGSKDLTLTGSTKYLRDGDFGPLYEDSKGTITEFGVIRYFETGTWEYQISEVSASDGYTVRRLPIPRPHRAKFSMPPVTQQKMSAAACLAQ